MPIDLPAARDFILRSARRLERAHFSYAFEDGDPLEVEAALLPYSSEDGGFGEALEPDLRGPASHPAHVQFALRMLLLIDLDVEVDAEESPLLEGVGEYLAGIALPDGDLPVSVVGADFLPCAAHWETSGDGPFGPSLAMSICASLRRLGVEHEWVERASAFSDERILRGGFTDAHEIGGALEFVVSCEDDTSERLEALVAALAGARWYLPEPDAKSYGLSPLQLAPSPESPVAELFARDLMERHLDALEAGQQKDGGWPIAFTPPSEAAVWEWRGCWTVDSLKILRAWGRL
ncbi:MAG: hypothetical protein VCC00_13380 [Deltaproteobacteria bacterium]